MPKFTVDYKEEHSKWSGGALFFGGELFGGRGPLLPGAFRMVFAFFCFRIFFVEVVLLEELLVLRSFAVFFFFFSLLLAAAPGAASWPLFWEGHLQVVFRASVGDLETCFW